MICSDSRFSLRTGFFFIYYNNPNFLSFKALMKAMLRVFLIAMVVLLGLATMGYFGLMLLSKSIINNRSCEAFNIDNVEYHAEINIPGLQHDSCYCNYFRGVKRNRFQLDFDELDMAQYIADNNLTQADVSEVLDSAGFLLPEAYHPKHTYFSRRGTYKHEHWRILLDSNSRKLWVTIWYGTEPG